MEKTSLTSSEKASEAKSVKPLLLLQILVNPFPKIDEFAAIEFFKVGINKKSGVNISFVSPGFFRHYATKVESVLKEHYLYGYKMILEKPNEEVIKTFGGLENAIVGLYDIWKKLERQPDGQHGGPDGLLVDGQVNTFFVQGSDDIVHAVRLRYLCGWQICANENEKNKCCGEGTHVFSHEMVA